MENWTLAVAIAAGVFECILKKKKAANPSPPPRGRSFGFDTDANNVVDGFDFIRIVSCSPAPLYANLDPDYVYYRCRFDLPAPGAVAVDSACIFRGGNYRSNSSTSAPDVAAPGAPDRSESFD